MEKIYTLGIWLQTMSTEDMSIPQSLVVALIGISVVLLELALIAVLIILLSKVLKVFTKKKTEEPKPAFVPPASRLPISVSKPVISGESNGSITLTNVDEESATIIMSVISEDTGISLNQLSFKSIKQIEEK